MHPHPHNMLPGQWEEMHVVVAGESLSRIAARFVSRGWNDLADWHPIFRLTRERTGLWRDKLKSGQLDNPDLIHPGDLLIIPRSRAGYHTAIQKTRSLLRDTMNAPGYAAQVKKEEEHFSERLNFLGDIITFVATAGASAATAARSASIAKLAVGAAAKDALKRKTLSAVDMGLKISEYAGKSTGHENVARYSGYAEKVVHVADLVHGAKDFPKDVKELHLKKEYWRLAGESIGQVVDVIDVALEWTQPSGLSKGLIRLFTGADVGSTIEQNVEAENRMKERLIHLLRKKIAALQHEMELVYAV
jgi:hypothetical protein